MSAHTQAGRVVLVSERMRKFRLETIVECLHRCCPDVVRGNSEHCSTLYGATLPRFLYRSKVMPTGLVMNVRRAIWDRSAADQRWGLYLLNLMLRQPFRHAILCCVVQSGFTCSSCRYPGRCVSHPSIYGCLQWYAEGCNKCSEVY